MGGGWRGPDDALMVFLRVPLGQLYPQYNPEALVRVMKVLRKYPGAALGPTLVYSEGTLYGTWRTP